MKKILFVINTMGRAGAENSMIELMKLYDKGLYELHLLSLIDRGEMFDQVPAKVVLHNKRRDSRPILSSKGFLIGVVLKAILQPALLRNLSGMWRTFTEQIKRRRIQYDKIFWRLLSDTAPVIEEHFDIAIAYLEGGATYYVADHVKADQKVAFVHIDYRKAGYTREQDQSCYEKMDRIFIVSEEARRSFFKVYPQFMNKTQLFYNVINKKEIQRKALDGEGFTEDYPGIRIVTVARLHYQKGLDLAIAALAELKKQNYPVRWYVIGDGELKQELNKLAARYGLGEDFIFLGARRNPYPFVKQCDLYVHVTRYEGRSIAIQEAQALGKAIVVSDCSGNRELIEDGRNGLIVPLEPTDIAKGIIRLMETPDLKKRIEQENCNKEFDFSGVIETMASIERSEV